LGGDNQQEQLLPVAQWSAQGDKALADEGVHERGVPILLLLLAH
jgi:hypothetical protein